MCMGTHVHACTYLNVYNENIIKDSTEDEYYDIHGV